MRRLAVLVLSLALVAAACGDDDGGSVDTEATTPVATATTASAATTAPTATSAPATTTTAAPTTTVAPGNPLVALAAAFAGDYTGAWNNTTFGSTGPIETSIVVDEVAETVTVTSDLGGFVFGGPDPDPTVTVIDLSAEPPYETSSELMGDSTFEISEEGMLTFTAPAVPGLGGLTFVMEGIPDPAGFPMTYRIENPDGSIFAEGTVDMAPA